MLHHQTNVICHECDALLHKPSLRPGQKLQCPRCGCTLYVYRRDTINRGLALSLTALVLLLPANFLPIMTFTLLGRGSAETLYRGVGQLFSQGYWWMAALVFLCSMLAPAVELILVLAICIMVKLRKMNSLLVTMLKLQGHVREWGMLEVFMLGILVAYVKMIDLGEIHLGIGLACFSGLLLATTLNAVLFDTHAIWEWVGEVRERRRHR